jgi:predicted O-methyltransferase YrrM
MRALVGHTRREVKVMSDGGREPPDARRTGVDQRPEVDRTNALHERLFGDALGALELYTIYLGERLGLYRALAEGGPATSSQLAARTGTSERYVREWLEQHAASDLLAVDDPRAEPLACRYWLPPEHIAVLANSDDIRYEANSGVDIVRAGRWLPQLVEAFRAGTAPSPLPWEPEGRAEPNRTRFINLLGTEWLPAIVDVDLRLRAEPPARVLDVACGTGWSSIAMAQAYSKITIDGVDLDHDAISAARGNAERAGVADRVRFSVTDAADLAGTGGYDLVTILEALHDMSRPVDALIAARRLISEDGTLLVADGLVAEEFTAPASPRERTEYGWSVVSCLPGAMGDPRTAATGAVMRPSVLRQYALQAGFGEVEVLPIHTDYWRFYRLLR